MIFGDNLRKFNESVDALGLNTYTVVPDLDAIYQSSNLYVYCGNNPVRYIDRTGNSWTASMWWLAAADGPIPVGDIAYGIGTVLEVIILGDTLIRDISNSSYVPPRTVTGVQGTFITIDSATYYGIDSNKKHHILQDRHNWNKLIPNPKDPKNWDKIMVAIQVTLYVGTEAVYKNGPAFIRSLEIDGNTVEVVYRIIDGIIKISDAWIK